MGFESRIMNYLRNLANSDEGIRYYRYNYDLVDWQKDLHNKIIVASSPEIAGAKLYLQLAKDGVYNFAETESEALEGKWNEEQLLNDLREDIEEVFIIGGHPPI